MGHHGTDYRLIMTVIWAVLALGPLSALFPVVEHIAGLIVAVLLVLGGLVVAGYVSREVRRELLFRAEMRALDRRDAARSAARIGGRR